MWDSLQMESQRQGYMGRGIYYVTGKETIASIKQISPTHSLFHMI
jgi:hypothetical protein